VKRVAQLLLFVVFVGSAAALASDWVGIESLTDRALVVAVVIVMSLAFVLRPH